MPSFGNNPFIAKKQLIIVTLLALLIVKRKEAVASFVASLLKIHDIFRNIFFRGGVFPFTKFRFFILHFGN